MRLFRHYFLLFILSFSALHAQEGFYYQAVIKKPDRSSPNDTFTNLVDQSNLKGTTYTIEISPNTFYSWKVVASDGKEAAKSQSFSFQTTPN